MTLKSKIIKCFEKKLKLSKKEIYNIKNNKLSTFKFGVHKNWDSLKHVELIVSLEKIARIKIDSKNFNQFSNLKSIFKLLKLK